MSYEYIRVVREDGIGTLVLNRPDKLNAFAGTMRREVADALDELEQDDTVRVIVLTGAGRAFCAGADIGYMSELIARRDEDAMAALVEAGRRVVTTMRASSKPVIGSINGPAAGGGANLSPAICASPAIAPRSARRSTGSDCIPIGAPPISYRGWSAPRRRSN